MNGTTPERPRKVDRNRKAKDDRLTKLGLRGERSDKPRCIHCGQPFDEWSSSGGRYASASRVSIAERVSRFGLSIPLPASAGPLVTSGHEWRDG